MVHRNPRSWNGWLALGLALHALTAALVVPGLLSSSTAPRSASEDRAPAGAELTPALAAAARLAPPGQREDASRRELRARVISATEALAQALESPEYADERWQVAVDEHARSLGAEALPALRALLADEERSVEEHVAATELAAALQR